MFDNPSHDHSILSGQNDSLSINPNEVILIDSSLASLANHFSANNNQIYVYDEIDNISAFLSQQENLEAIHLYSHGNTDLLQIGSTSLTSENLEEYGDTLTGWGNALGDTGDILLYGCNVGNELQGQEFLQQISDITGADVQVSDDLTGDSLLGGDWDLEYEIGEIETEAIAVNDFAGLLTTKFSTNVVGDTVTFTSTLGNFRDNLNIGINNGNITLKSIPPTGSISPPESISQSLSGISNIVIKTGRGDDTIAFSTSLSGYGLTIDTESGNDTVTFNKNIFTNGKNLSVNAETINVNSDFTVSTRNIGTSTDHLGGISVGQSGNLSFTGVNVTVDNNAELFSHVDTNSQYNPGNITITTRQTREFIENFGFVVNSNTSFNLNDGAEIKGNNITIQSTANSTNLYTG